MKKRALLPTSLYFIWILFLAPISLSAQTTFTSVQDGDWNDCTTWGAGPCTSTEGVTYPSRNDEVIINHNVTINAVTDNNAAGGAAPNSLTGVCDIRNFNNCNRNSFFHNGIININATGTLTANRSLLLSQDVIVDGGNLIVQNNVNNDIFFQGRLDIINGANLDIIDNLVLSQAAVFNVDNLSTADVGDDLIIDGEDAIVCGTGEIGVDRTMNGSNARNNSIIHISPNNPSVLLDQICAELTISCEDGNCASGGSDDGDIGGVAGPGDGVISPADNTPGDPNNPDNNRPSSGEVLPVELLFFNAILNGNESELTWSTASELDNDFFTIERSINGQDWENITELTGAGTTDERQDYRYIDRFPLPGTSFYRLKQTDFDGKFSFSNIESITKKVDQRLEMSPNPTNGELSIRVNPDLTILSIKAIDLNGKAINIQLPSSIGNQYQFDLSTYVANVGIYLIQIQTNAGITRNRVSLN